MPTLHFDTPDGPLTFEAVNLVVAGWTGRDKAAIQHHIEELVELGVAPPSATPVFYRAGVELLVQTDSLQVLGPDTSGEVEFVLLANGNGLYVTVGSDHTDRKAEAIGVALSKQLSGKVLGKTAWRLDDVLNGWDKMTIKSWATINGEKVLYQDATLGSILSPQDLMAAYTGGGELAPGTAMMSGTPPAIGGIRPADRFDMEITNPATGTVLAHGYAIEALPVVS